jgi:hypothetical protein
MDDKETGKHYKRLVYDPLYIMSMDFTPEQYIGFLRGNILKYVLRDGLKDEPIQEARKLLDYAYRLVSYYEDLERSKKQRQEQKEQEEKQAYINGLFELVDKVYGEKGEDEHE